MMMSISERERQALGSIEDRLACSAPQLASMLAIFSRLTAGEEMPARERVRRGALDLRSSPAAARQAGSGQVWRHRTGRAAWVWLWLTVVVAVVLLGLSLNLPHGAGRGTCSAWQPVSCAQTTAGFPVGARDRSR
jgi:hypothetical protein